MNRFLRGLTACVLFLGVLCSSLFGQVPYGKALKAKRNGQVKLFANAGVVGAGVSFDGNGQAQIKVFVKNAKVRGITKQIDGVPVVVAVSGEFSAYGKVKKQAPGGKKKKTRRWR
ncbi:MAG: hypothetical protein VXZ82_24915 [Planctomycetota bacterium]|nr:hypothetical protein [Planctomycetota bacterium]